MRKIFIISFVTILFLFATQSAEAFLKLPDPCAKSLYACPVPAALVTGNNDETMFGITWKNTVIEVYTDQGVWLGDAFVDRSKDADIVPWSIDLTDKLTDGKHYLFFITYNLSKRDRSYKSDVFPFYLNYTGVVLKNDLVENDDETTLKQVQDKTILKQVQDKTTITKTENKPVKQTSEQAEKETTLITDEKNEVENIFQNTESSSQTEGKNSYGTVIGYAIIGIFVVLIIIAMITRRDDDEKKTEKEEEECCVSSGCKKYVFIIKKWINTSIYYLSSLWNRVCEKTSTNTPLIKEKTSSIIFSSTSFIKDKFKNTRTIYDSMKTKIENLYNTSITGVDKEDNKKE